MPIIARERMFGAYAFLIGFFLSLIAGIFTGLYLQISPIVFGILSILGIVVGFTVPENDSRTFLLAAVSLVIVSYAGISGFVLGASVSGIQIGRIISSTLQTMLALFVPATVVVAIKTMFSISRV
jgi:hypothetical protein